MSWREVVIESKCKLEYKNNFLIVRGEVEKRVHLSEISCVILASTAISMTAALSCRTIWILSS
ncbi:MAG: hypothetical protein RSD04_06120 [Clostridia bacterium]